MTIFTVWAAIVGILLWIFWGKYLADRGRSQTKKEAEKLKKEAAEEIEATKKECRRLYDIADRKWQELIEKAEKEIVHRHKKVDQMEEKINQKEEQWLPKIHGITLNQEKTLQRLLELSFKYLQVLKQNTNLIKKVVL